MATIMIDTGNPLLNEEVLNFQKNMKKFFPTIDDTILHLAVVDFLNDWKEGKLDSCPLIQRYVRDHTDDKQFNTLQAMSDLQIELE